MGTKVAEDTILWRRLDRPGHESARLSVEGSSRCLEGTAVFDHEGAPCRLDYDIVCDSGFETLRGSVAGWVGERSIRIEIGVEEGEWWLDGSECPAVQGAVDLDLNFSPSTNLLPIRRLNLEVGQESAV
ncbi:MAG: putative glycolipid-binding domain-containing protein, partial [Vicinamibacteria bacterium]